MSTPAPPLGWYFRRSFHNSMGNPDSSAKSGPLWGTLAAILDFAGGAELQAVSKSPRRR